MQHAKNGSDQFDIHEFIMHLIQFILYHAQHKHKLGIKMIKDRDDKHSYAALRFIQNRNTKTHRRIDTYHTQITIKTQRVTIKRWETLIIGQNP